ncbi:MAG: hypothetical protein FWB73_01740 [Treponema sp.]|nr:hypothetical protein [Treponema sp.]
MVTKRLIVFFFLSFCLIPNIIFAQDIGANYFIETEGGEQRIRQRLTWRGGANTYRYEVIIEKNENGSFVPIIREFSSATFIIVSLFHGNYRFRVIPYDIFDIAGQPSEWRNLEVRQALKPQLSEAQPEIMLDTNGDPYGFVVYISGNNLHHDAEFFLRHPNNTRTVLDDVEYGEDGDVRIYIDSTNLEPGEYNIIVKNPGGFEAEIQRTVINHVIEQIAKNREQKKEGGEPLTEIGKESDISYRPYADTDEEENVISDEEIIPVRKLITKLNIGWSPFFGVYGFDFSSLANIFINISLIGKLPIDFYLGAELGMSISAIDASKLVLNINMLIQKYIFKDIVYINFRAGTGIAMFPNENEESKVFINAGLSFSWRITKFLILDAGANYMHIFGGFQSGSVSPWIGIGFQF